MSKGVRGGKRNYTVLQSSVKFSNNDSIKELEYYVDSNGITRLNGYEGWSLDFNTHSQAEIEDGKWLQNVIGEQVYLMPAVNLPKEVRSSDYITESGIRIEHKAPGENSKQIARVIEEGKGQATVFLVDITKTTITKSQIDNEIPKIFYKYKSTQHAETIYVKRGDRLIGKYEKGSTSMQK